MSIEDISTKTPTSLNNTKSPTHTRSQNSSPTPSLKENQKNASPSPILVIKPLNNKQKSPPQIVNHEQIIDLLSDYLRQ